MNIYDKNCFLPVRNFFQDEKIRRVYINGYDSLYIESSDSCTKGTDSFSSPEELTEMLNECLASVNRPPLTDQTFAHFRMQNGVIVAICRKDIKDPVVILSK